ncbi:MAG: type I DNA topoisomerase [Candidatus Bipolaricaulota bacterium]|nr:type I DNA topoisomerase [Candidatus Bipolaricaulota bacterium]
MHKLIIVESPTKARTIGQYLGKAYKVLSSQGHVRDLPRNDLGVDIENGFEPKFETKRTKLVKELRDAAKGAERVYLATDHDREGEAIAYDLYTILKRVIKDNNAFSRPIFNEITKPVILEALKSPTGIDMNRVEAQRTRRILDRLVGYQVSPILSMALAGNRFEGLSAGRVQSVALRFLCDREGEIDRFVPAEYWEIEALLRNGEPFSAKLSKKGGKKFVIRNKEEAQNVIDALHAAKITVASLEEKKRRRQPSPPFITSSLQQTASSALHFTPKRTMKIAQELYEGVKLPEGSVGLITYMRTDSVRMSDEAVSAAREIIERSYGEKYLEKKPRQFKNKKRSQDAHEAIRPTNLSLTPQSIGAHLSPDQRKLYTLIYNRFLATQMTPAVYLLRKALIAAGVYTLEAGGSTLAFDGFLKLFPEQRSQEKVFPSGLREGLELVLEKIESAQKFTEPPRRYSEAGLVNLLEKEGVGRPSTYASIISVIQDRGYAVKEGGSLRPTLLGQVVVDFLKQNFTQTVESEFTAHMEEDLDKIEEGSLTRKAVLDEFYAPFSKRLQTFEENDGGKEHRFHILTDVACDKCGVPMELRYWKGSHFLGCSNYPECKNTKSLPPEFPYHFEGEKLILREGLEEMEKEAREHQFPCPECGSPMELKSGRYGRYYKCTNPECGKTASISTGVPCPVCKEGVLVEKYSAKRRRTFYSCSRYPDCRFAVSEKPVKVCPSCDSGVLVEKRDKLVCSNKDCDYTEEVK